jgi:hypothetical protein
MSDPWTTISGNPTQQHAFQPVHNTTIIEVNKVVDGSTQKYLAYDCDPDGSQIRLYYTNDTSSSWTAYSGNPILGPSSYHYRWPSVCYSNGTFHMFLGDRTDLTLERWTSTDGIHYEFEENIKTGGNQWKTPFIWFNPNDSRFYLYSHDAVGGTEYVKVRNATSIEGLHGAVDTIVVSQTASFGAASVMYYNNTYWLLAEIFRGSTWQVIAYSSLSPSSGFQECYNSPILIDDEACPILLLDSDQARAHLFVTRANSIWYQDTREVYINEVYINDRLIDYQIRITAHYGSGTDEGENVYLNGHTKADFGDVRFAWLNSSSGSEVACDYWIEKSNVGDNALFWVKIPEISNEANSTIHIYYGKMDANTTANGYNTFDFFDDFSGDLSKWTIEHFDGSGSASIVDGWARVNAQPGGDFWGYRDGGSGLFTVAPLDSSYAIETMFRQQSYLTNDVHNRFLMSRANLNDHSAFYTMLFDGDSSHITTNWRDANGAYTDWAGEHTGWARGSNTIFQARLVKSGTTYHAYISTDGKNWYSAGSRSGNYQGYIGLVDSYHDGYTEFDWVRVRKCVEPEPTHGDWGTEDISQCVIIDQTFVSAARVNVGSVQTIGFHAKWNNNGSDVVGGSIYVNGTVYVTNSTGWINIRATGRREAPDNFTIIALPDTQFYSASHPEIFDNQTQWIVNNAQSMNIVFVTHEGDIVDDYSSLSQWNNANNSMSKLDAGNVSYGVLPGNHDGSPLHLSNFNKFFNYSRFNGENWYGGAYQNENTNNFELFRCGQDDYLIFHFQYDPSDQVLAWANSTLQNYPNRRVIVTTHSYLNVDGSRTDIGNRIWQNFVAPHADQIFLVLCGHNHGEKQRTDIINGHTVYQTMADYQDRTDGGNGWLRILEFHPAEDKIYVRTYSPYLNNYETDANSQFTLDYNMTWVASSIVEKVTWTVTGVNCSGVTAYSQIVQNPSIIWDRINISDEGTSKGLVMLGEKVTVWFKALYEYDNDTFDGANGVLYLNGSAMLWSTTNNRWQYDYTATTLGTKTFIISGVSDSSYNLTVINDNIGAQTLDVWSLPFSVISNSTISEVTFNSTNRVLSFTVSGPPGTVGYTNVTIAKDLIANISELKVNLDGNQINYTTTSTDYSWLIHFTYGHSTHKIVILLSSLHANSSYTVSLEATTILSGIIIVILAAILLVYKKVHKKRAPESCLGMQCISKRWKCYKSKQDTS